MAARKKNSKSGTKAATSSRKKPQAPTKRKGPRDLRGELRALRDMVIDGLMIRPGASARERARQGAWDTILRQRAPESRRRLEDLMRPRRWAFGDGEDDPGIALLPTHMDHAIRQAVIPVYTRLAGALKQYHTVRVVWRPKLQFGIRKGGNEPIGSKSAVAKQRAAAEKERLKKKAAREKEYARVLDTILEDFTEKRDLLRGVLDGLQSVTDGILRVEETRLGELARAAPKDVRDRAAPLLLTLKQRRIEAKDFRTLAGERSSEYASVLRAWNGARGRAARALA